MLWSLSFKCGGWKAQANTSFVEHSTQTAVDQGKKRQGQCGPFALGVAKPLSEVVDDC